MAPVARGVARADGAGREYAETPGPARRDDWAPGGASGKLATFGPPRAAPRAAVAVVEKSGTAEDPSGRARADVAGTE